MGRGLPTHLVLLVLLWPGGACAADSSLWRWIPPDSNLLAWADVSSIRRTPLGAWLDAKISGQQWLPASNAMGNRPIVWEIHELLAGGRADSPARSLIMVARVNLRREQVVTLTRSRRLETLAYSRALMWRPDPNGSWVGFLDGVLVMGRELDAVRRAVDRYRSNKSPESTRVGLAPLDQSHQAVFYCWGAPPASLPGIHSEILRAALSGDLIQRIRGLRLFADLDQSVHLDFVAEGADEAHAAALCDLARFVLSMLRLQTGPGLANAWERVSQGMQIGSEGTRCRVRVDSSYQDTVQILEACSGLFKRSFRSP